VKKTCKIRTLSLRMAFTTGGRFPRARPQPRANRTLVMKALRHDVAFLAFLPLSNLLVVGSSDSCCSRDEQDVLVSSFGHRTCPVLADQESPPYVTAIRVRSLTSKAYGIYSLNSRILFNKLDYGIDSDRSFSNE